MPLNYVGPSYNPQVTQHSSNSLVKLTKTSDLNNFEKALEVENISVNRIKTNNVSEIQSSNNYKHQQIDSINRKLGDEKKIKNLHINKNQLSTFDRVDKNGTNIAIKEVAIEIEQQFLGFLWNLAVNSSGEKFEGGIGEEVFSKELTQDILENTNNGEMGELAQQIYDEAILIDGEKGIGDN